MAQYITIDGERVCKVLSTFDCRAKDGSLELKLPLKVLESITDGSGLMVVDYDDGDQFVVQALALRPVGDGLIMKCSPLGLLERTNADEDDDWLIIKGYEPVRVLAWAEASADCPRGHHIRLEILTRDWIKLPVQVTKNPNEDWAENAPAEESSEDADSFSLINDATEFRWPFRDVIANPDGQNGQSKVLQADLVQLRPRLRSDITIDVAYTSTGTTSLIGHVRKVSAIPQTRKAKSPSKTLPKPQDPRQTWRMP